MQVFGLHKAYDSAVEDFRLRTVDREGNMNPSNLQRSFILVSLVLLGNGCSHTIPEYSVKTIPPPQFSTPPPMATQTVGQLPESVLPVTLTADLTPIQRTIEQAVPDGFTETKHPLGVDFRWTFIRDGEPQVAIQDGLVTFRAAYRGDIEARASARACRLDPLYSVMDGTGQLALTQQGENLVFSLVNPQITMSLKPESDSKCNMFNIPVKDQLPELINQEALKQEIANAVKRATFKIPLHQVWEHLQGPLSVSIVPFNTQLCLYGKPTEIIVGNLKGTMQHTTVTGVARETPTAMYENVCHHPPVTPMKVSSGSVAAEGRPFKILASIPIPYATLNHELRDKLFHQEMVLDTTFKDKVVIEHVSAADANGRVLITLQTSGNLTGTIYYWGTPQLNDGGTVLTIPDLQMLSESKTALDSIKVGYWQLVDKELRDKVRKAATIDLSQRIGTMKTAMTGQHKSGDLTMDVLVARQHPERAYSTPQAVVADILLEGTASMAGRLPVEGAVQPSSPGAMMSAPPSAK